jgi:metal-dependent amidase/aminoacylase/carboxypeptidase family protein
VNSIIIKLEGITAHAGEPEKGINPAMAIVITITTTLFRLTFQRKLLPDYPIYTQHGKKSTVLWELEKFILR